VAARTVLENGGEEGSGGISFFGADGLCWGRGGTFRAVSLGVIQLLGSLAPLYIERLLCASYFNYFRVSAEFFLEQI